MEKDIGKIKKNEIADIVVRIDDFGGRPGLTIREFATSERYTGFTKSGTRIPAESFSKFKEMINSIDESDFPGGSVPKAPVEPKEENKDQKTLSQPEEKPTETGEQEEIKEEVL